MKNLALLFLSLLLFGATEHKSTTVMIQIEPYKVFQNYEHFKRLVLKSNNPDAEFIEGFEFEWGYSYKILVKEEKLAQTLSDGTRAFYSLHKIVSKTKAPDSLTFNLMLDNNLYYQAEQNDTEPNGATLKKLNDSTYLYFDEVELEIPAKFKENFLEIVEGKRRDNGKFKFVGKNRIRLIGL